MNQQAGLRTSDDLEVLAQGPTPTTLEAPYLINSHDRRHWKPVVVPVPLRTTEVQPTYGSSDAILRDSPRQRGIFPSEEIALATEFDVPAESGEVILAPLQFLGEAIIAPFQMLVRWPWNVENAPANEYQRIEHIEPPYALEWIDPAAAAPSTAM